MLRLTKKADYSLIALKHLASRQFPGSGAEAVSAKEVADFYGIPLALLSKLLQKLMKSGLLISEHGTNGGYRLARDPRLISALEVVQAIDGPTILTECFTEHNHCDHAARCSVRRPLRRLHEGLLRLLASVTIQDMVNDDSEEEPASPVPLVALQQGTPLSSYRER